MKAKVKNQNLYVAIVCKLYKDSRINIRSSLKVESLKASPTSEFIHWQSNKER